MANSKNTDLELRLTAVELALAFNDLLEESARKGAAQIEAMSDEEIERFLAEDEKPAQPWRWAAPVSTATWRGLLGTLVPKIAVADATLGDACAGAGHVGVKIDLRTVFEGQLDRDLTWTSGLLQVEAAYSDLQTISSLRISVGVKGGVSLEDRPLLVQLADHAGGLETVSLNVARPSIALSRPALSGPFKELELTVSVAANPPA